MGIRFDVTSEATFGMTGGIRIWGNPKRFGMAPWIRIGMTLSFRFWGDARDQVWGDLMGPNWDDPEDQVLGRP